MPNSKSAKKRLRQNAKQKARNKDYKTQVHTQVRKFETAVAAQDADAAQKEFLKAAQVLDTVAGKGIVHKNTASRKKSRMQRQLRGLTAGAPAESQETASEEAGQ